MRRSSQGKSSCAGAGSGGGLQGAGDGRSLLSCYAKAKPRPSKWDDAQKWLSRAPDADDRVLLPPPAPAPAASRKGEAPAADDGEDAGETKRVDSASVQAYERQRRVSLRDVGTEMTPGGSKKPSRANTPRAAAVTSPGRRGGWSRGSAAAGLGAGREAGDVLEEAAAVSPATAWDEAERAKYMARYRREEMKIQVWENRERRKAELQMKMTEVKAERMKLRAQEKAAGKLAAAQALAEERRAGAEARLSRRAARARGKAGMLRRSRSGGHLLPASSFSLKLPLLCS